MTPKFSKSLKRTLAFTSALAVVASCAIVNTADARRRKSVYESKVSDFTSMMPGLTGTKLRLSDPKFSSKEWYEYIDYEYYTTVEDDDTIFKIYKPVNYGNASVMAIADHEPDNTSNLGLKLSMSIQEDLQTIFDMAAQGQNISEGFANLTDFNNGISKSMNSIGDIMDNSKYYSNLSNLGIPNDEKYKKGISNTGFYTASSISIAISDTNSISAGKVVSANSSYDTSVSNTVRKDYSDYTEAANAVGRTIDYSETIGAAITDTAGREVTNTEGFERTLSQERTIADTFSETYTSGFSYSHEEGHEEEWHEGSESHWEVEAKVGAEAKGKIPLIGEAQVSGEIGGNVGHNWSEGSSETDSTSDTYEWSSEYAQTYERSHSVTDGISDSRSIEQSIAKSQEHSVSASIDTSQSTGQSFEESLTKGSGSSTGREQENAIAIGIGYGVDYQAGNGYEHSSTVTRTFDARDDKLVNGVAWKLCDYVVKVPFYVEAIDKSSVQNTTEDPVVLYGQYVEYNLLQGVCRVFANGYIEHWYTGELVNYADFFDGFITASELIDKAKAQQSDKVPKGA